MICTILSFTFSFITICYLYRSKYVPSIYALGHRHAQDLMAWRSGTGAVSLAMTSNCNENNLQKVDFCFANDGNAKWYKDPNFSQVERNLKEFRGSLLEESVPPVCAKTLKSIWPRYQIM